ncbi:uncharacterized protein LOC122856664 isoform X2 [Aphidius gifuensis]|nr:uncharacterized protein LOC122856664 isoform X2 [Aphidius gifuensis]XP_044014352.1 uncharacterized protein LOC122856664 isoform X2 [Aphidius gifuensis]
MEKLVIVILTFGLFLICSVGSNKSTRFVRQSGPNDIYATDYWNRNLIFRADVEQRELEKQLREEDELIRVLRDDSLPIDAVKWDSVGDRVISRANVTDETKRIVRQIKKQRPGFFWTLFRVTFETVNETKAAIQQISEIVSNSISPETTTSKLPLMSKKTSSNDTINSNGTSTEAPFTLTQSVLQTLIRRNVKGLVRLFNIEWNDAVKQSKKNVKQFKKELGKSVAPFLADNPNIN